MEYVRYFEEHSAHQVFLDNDLFGEPTLSYCGEERDVVCRPYKELPYLKFTVDEVFNDSSQIRFNLYGNNSTALNNIDLSNKLEYSIDDGKTWETYTFTKYVQSYSSAYSGKTLTLYQGDSVMFRGELPLLPNSACNYGFNLGYSYDKISASGYITSLFDKDCNPVPVSCKQMFSRCASLTSAPELPSKTLVASAYTYMFSGCTSLATAPKLPATTLANNCYYGMFQNCPLLTTAPELPATTLATSCYNNMFQNCRLLKTAPVLPATTLADNCYNSMFQGCTSLTTAPVLPATTIPVSAYTAMFSGCKSLTTAPELPATTLANYCYQSMFNGCTSLATAPELPATALTFSCYRSMFNGCTSLTTAPELPATTLTGYCYSSMFQDCTSLATAPELPAMVLTESCYSSMFYGCSALTAAPELPAVTLANSAYTSMFYNCKNIGYIKAMFTTEPSAKYTSNWVYGVKSTGTFVKNSAATWTTTGVNGVPTGWTVQTASS